MIKNNKGVTLISLVVTIIVMLILAGLTLNYTIGDNGLISKSKEIKKNTLKAEAEGQEIIDTVKEQETYIEDGTTNIVDQDAPVINSMEITKITTNSFKVKVNVTETGVGIAKVEYSIDDGVSYTTPPIDNQAKTYTFENLKSNQEYKVKVRVTDKEGREATASDTVTTK